MTTTHRTVVDAVTTFWEPGPEPFSGALVFLAGARHETFTTVEVSHLVEHLVMSTLGKSHLDCNAAVDEESTTFFATGPRDEVLSFLTSVCQALSALPLERLGREATVLQAEDGNATHPAIEWSIGRRTGLVGLGLMSTRGVGVHKVTAESVQRFAATRFVKGNAVLVLSGAPPEDLRLPLPDGPRPLEEPWTPQALPLPALVIGEVPRPTLSLIVPSGPVGSVVAEVIRQRVLDDLRHERGLVYDVDGGGIRLTEDQGLATYVVDGAEKDRPAIVERLLEIVRELAEKGPTQAEMDHERQGLARDLADPRTTMAWLERLALRHLRGAETLDRDAEIALQEAVTPADVRRAAQDALDTMLLGVPEGLARLPDGLTDRTDWAPEIDLGSGIRRFRRKGMPTIRMLTISVGDQGLALTTGRHSSGGAWEDVIGLGTGPGVREVVFRHGDSFPVFAKHFQDAAELVALLDQRLGHLAFPVTEDELLGT